MFNRNLLTTVSVTAALSLIMALPAQAVFFHIGSGSIDGSLCVGNDCVSAEAFGFDTLRLKENNLRLHFDDTSSTASFPRNDWRLTANDSANGGNSHFSIEDATAGRFVFRAFAGARSNALVIDSQGDLGLGTTTPAQDIDIKTGDTPSIRLQQDGTSGFTPQSWDVAGNEAGFFVRDATSGSTLPFRIMTGGAPSQSLVIDDTGNVGVGAGTSPEANLHVRASGSTLSPAAITVGLFQNSGTATDNARLSVVSGNAGNVQIALGDTDNEIAGRIRYNHGADTMDIFTGGNVRVLTLDGGGANVLSTATSTAVLTAAGVWQNASSRALKQNIRDLSLTDALDTLEGLEPVTYNYKVEPGETTVGFIAEDVPELVATASHKTLSSMDIVAVLTRVVQEQRDEIASLESRLQALEAAQ